ncbi:UNVERIFIED_ORG: aspartate aminotransferase-like enzyme [Arthrobacter sp. UYEF13]
MPQALTSRFLFGPGPSNCYPEVTAALAHPVIGHLDPVFIERLDNTCEGLRTVWGTRNARTLPLSVTGSGGMEAAFVNTVDDGDVAVIAVNGLFGERMCEVARRCGATVVRVDHEWGTPIDVERVLTVHPQPKVIAAVHAETSTGVLSDVASLGQNKGDALLIVDAVTSIGGLELRADDWGIDVGYAGTQKCLGVPPGLSLHNVGQGLRAKNQGSPLLVPGRRPAGRLRRGRHRQRTNVPSHATGDNDRRIGGGIAKNSGRGTGHGPGAPPRGRGRVAGGAPGDGT